ncbi:bifunctional 2-polyprenyl-6-hydroxyphenol methylase/3-demethylubiquinol 3-O-methyltransferase UbiG [Kribbella sp. VKM Ac-2568]|uniref:class I SAM-dependent methyltransferase n=1 Tax=Kribbella sp. VKM Ac-2568 TaxID=2512219 RepID=UPI0010476109|nr:methyltransferase domain-containing protein [Kribbella sp. VKM Ac-2568]
MNLMCPARLIVLPPAYRGSLTGERIARVYAGPGAEEPAGLLAENLGVQLVGLPSGPGDEVLREIADQHRGETVAVIAPTLDLPIALPAGRVVIEHDGDGWSILPSANEVTLAAYEQAADRFRESIPRDPNGPLLELLDLAGDRLRPGATVLELGSGTGRDAVELEERGYRVRRTDAAWSFVEMMRADGFEADQLNALVDDFGGPYDVVFADAVFLHFDPDQLAVVLRKAREAAGLLAFTTREGDGDEWSNRYLDLPRHFTMWQEEPLRQLLTDTGWTVLHLERHQSRVGGWFYVLATA